MNKNERIKAALNQDLKPDKVPLTIYSVIFPQGSPEIELRNSNFALIKHSTVYDRLNSKVKIKETTEFFPEDRKKIIFRTYETSKGKLRSKHERYITGVLETGYRYTENVYTKSMFNGRWTKEYIFKKESDYELLEYIIRKTEFRPNYDDFLKSRDILGTEGVVVARVPKSPFQSILLNLMGIEKTFLEAHKRPKKFRHLYDILFEQQKEIYKIVAQSPADIIWCPDNIHGDLISPKYFSEFCVPFYNKVGNILHNQDKVYMVHMDGNLNCLKNSISEAKGIDVIEAITPPPMGDISLTDARKTWADKILWANFPENILDGRPENSVRKFTEKILKKMMPGNDFLMGITEDYPIDQIKTGLKAVDEVFAKRAVYPPYEKS